MDLTTLVLSIITTVFTLKIIQVSVNYYLWIQKIKKIPTPNAGLPIIGWSWKVINLKAEGKLINNLINYLRKNV